MPLFSSQQASNGEKIDPVGFYSTVLYPEKLQSSIHPRVIKRKNIFSLRKTEMGNVDKKPFVWRRVIGQGKKGKERKGGENRYISVCVC